ALVNAPGRSRLKADAHHNELVSTQTSDEIGSSERGFEDARGRDERLVSVLVTQLVVDALHPIEVDKGEGHRVAVALGKLQLLVPDGDEAVPVVEARQGIRQRNASQRGHDTMAFA